MPQIVDLETFPKDKTIEVHLKSGSVYLFEKWALDGKGTILGMSRDDILAPRYQHRIKWSTRVVRADSIMFVRTHDNRLAVAARTAVILGGFATAFLLVNSVINFYSDFSFGR